jgi:glycosyltransferase involved in cell wall biosynthesis
MKVLLVCTSDVKGGAAIAASRLLSALRGINVDARMLVQTKKSGNENVTALATTRLKEKINFLKFAFEKLIFWFFEKSKEVRFAFTLGMTGEDISKHPLVKEADIIHLHWVNNSFMSISNIKNLLSLGKPVVWTLHDMWAFTGGCHYSGVCNNFKGPCGNCRFLKNPKPNDLSNSIFEKKQKIYNNKNLTFVGCSNWMAGKARESKLLANFSITSIPNPIDTNNYKPSEKDALRNKYNLPIDKKIILFGADNIFDERKGFKYLLKALEILSNQIAIESLHCVIFGKAKQTFKVPFSNTQFNYISSQAQLIDLYCASDAFILPSLEDNLPNTVMEAMSCGLPTVAFGIGGLPEMIDHKLNGYLALPENSDDLATGILYILSNSVTGLMGINARQKVLENYMPEIVANKYLKLYSELLNK